MARRPGKTIYALVRKAFGAENLTSQLGQSVDPKIWDYLNSGRQTVDTPAWRMQHNRAYRTPEDVLTSAEKSGLTVKSLDTQWQRLVKALTLKPNGRNQTPALLPGTHICKKGSFKSSC